MVRAFPLHALVFFGYESTMYLTRDTAADKQRVENNVLM